MTEAPEFKQFRKIPRLSRECVITEKIDGTNALIYIADDAETIYFGSRSRWITPDNDNHGFATWGHIHMNELLKLGPGWHYGEWWGPGINRGYGQREKRFSLFNTSKWSDDSVRPSCCHVVPVLYTGPFDTARIEATLTLLGATGSQASPGFMRPEGIVVYHVHGGVYFKKTLEKDEERKGNNR